MPATDTDHNYHIKAIELIQPIVWGLYHTTSRTHIHTHAHTRTHTHTHILKFVDRSNSKKPGMPGLKKQNLGEIFCGERIDFERL